MRQRATSPYALFLLTLLAATSPQDAAGLWINELYFDPPSSGDISQEFIELRGAPGMSLANHYLLFIENEDNIGHTGSAGVIDNIFSLDDKSIGSNGFLTLRQKDSPYTDIAPGTADYVNAGTLPGWGTTPSTNTIGAHNSSLILENSGFTAMLIRNDGDPTADRPVFGDDLDIGNDGLDNPNGKAAWTIVDAIGVFSEDDEAIYGRTYAPITFAAAKIGDTFDTIDGEVTFTTPNIEPGSEFVGLGYEIEYVGRWGNSTGQTANDWHVSNLTNDTGSGCSGAIDFRQSGTFNFEDDHPPSDSDPATPAPQPTAPGEYLESNKGVPYGTKLLTNLGGPNYLTGDYNGDGVVNAADYTVWRDTEGAEGTESDHPAADHNHDFDVDDADYAIWAASYGAPFASPAPPATAAPEPGALVGAALLALGVLTRRARLG